MKKKIALLLAMVMILTSLPMTVFASTNATSGTVNAEALTVFYERGMVTGTGTEVRHEGANAINHWTEGTDLVITLSNSVQVGDIITLTLEGGAQWFFRQRELINLPIVPAGSAMPDRWSYGLRTIPGTTNPAFTTWNWVATTFPNATNPGVPATREIQQGPPPVQVAHNAGGLRLGVMTTTPFAAGGGAAIAPTPPADLAGTTAGTNSWVTPANPANDFGQYMRAMRARGTWTDTDPNPGTQNWQWTINAEQRAIDAGLNAIFAGGADWAAFPTLDAIHAAVVGATGGSIGLADDFIARFRNVAAANGIGFEGVEITGIDIDPQANTGALDGTANPSRTDFGLVLAQAEFRNWTVSGSAAGMTGNQQLEGYGGFALMPGQDTLASPPALAIGSLIIPTGIAGTPALPSAADWNVNSLPTQGQLADMHIQATIHRTDEYTDLTSGLGSINTTNPNEHVVRWAAGAATWPHPLFRLQVGHAINLAIPGLPADFAATNTVAGRALVRAQSTAVAITETATHTASITGGAADNHTSLLFNLPNGLEDIHVNGWGRDFLRGQALTPAVSAVPSAAWTANWTAAVTNLPDFLPGLPTPLRAPASDAAIQAERGSLRSTFVVGHDPILVDRTPGLSGFGFLVNGNTPPAIPGMPNIGSNIMSYFRVTELSNPGAQAGPAMLSGNFNNNNAQNNNVPYRLDINTSTAMNVATLHIMANAGAGDRIVVPMVIRTTGDGDYRVRIETNIAHIQNTTVLIGSRQIGRTNAVAENLDARVGERRFRLHIHEMNVGALVSSHDYEFELVAPRGWHWQLPAMQDADANNARLHSIGNNGVANPNVSVGDSRLLIHTNRGLRWNTSAATWNAEPSGGIANAGGITVNYAHDRHGRAQEDRIHVMVPANTFRNHPTMNGELIFNGLRLVADDFEDINFSETLNVQIRNVGNRHVLTNQTIAVGNAIDFGFNLTRVPDNIPELISGRLEGRVIPPATGSTAWDEDRINDDEHRAATVRFQETAIDSWWGERNMIFTLPEGVRFLKVDFEDVRHLTGTGPERLYAGNVGTGNVSANRMPWFNTGARVGSAAVSIDHNRMVLHNFRTAENDRARFDMNIWLNIQVDFEGPIYLSLSNPGFRQLPDNYEVDIQIATAVRPIEVITQVSEARVGFQFVTVADFDIVENVPGALLQAEEVFVTVTDLMSLDMAFAPGFRTAVTDGNIRISNVRVAGGLGTLGAADWHSWLNQTGGQMVFEVERASTVASTISFNDIQVRIDRTVPFSNISNIETSGYDIHVWGPAVAKNFRGLYSRDYVHGIGSANTRMNERDLFLVGSISEQYVRIETPGELAHALFGRHVAVPIPGSTVRIDSQEQDLGTETWIDAATSSAMVPIRFIAYALGLDQSAVRWDALTSTVTIDGGHRIVQFQTGNSAYLVNGVPVRMTNSEGVPVEMQIRDERSFVPFRALGEAFGIPVSWDPDTATAYYNEPSHF